MYKANLKEDITPGANLATLGHEFKSTLIVSAIAEYS